MIEFGLEFSICSSPLVIVVVTMPNTLSRKATLTARTKAAGEVLEHAKLMKQMAKDKVKLKEGLLKLRADRKKAARKCRTLKAKAAKTDLSELLQIMMMKAYIVSQEKHEAAGGASSSTEPWVPSNPKEAFEVIEEAVDKMQSDEVSKLAQDIVQSASS